MFISIYDLLQQALPGVKDLLRVLEPVS